MVMRFSTVSDDVTSGGWEQKRPIVIRSQGMYGTTLQLHREVEKKAIFPTDVLFLPQRSAL